MDMAPAAPPRNSPEEVLSDVDTLDNNFDDDLDHELARMDFSTDFSIGPGRAEIIKAIALRWNLKYEVLLDDAFGDRNNVSKLKWARISNFRPLLLSNDAIQGYGQEGSTED